MDALDRSRTVVFLLGGPVEQHGPHLPLGTDIYAARCVHERIVERVVAAGYIALLAPPVLYGTAVLSADYPGSSSVRREVLTEFLIDVLTSFADDGFDQIVTTSQHIDPPYVRAWEAACGAVNERYGARAIHGYERFVLEDVLDRNLDVVLGVDMSGDSHAGTFETAVVRFLRPDLVDEAAVASLPPIPLDFRSDLQQANSFRALGDGRGYTGNPRLGTKDRGATLMDRYTARYWQVVERYLAGEDVRADLALPAPQGSAEGRR